MNGRFGGLSVTLVVAIAAVAIGGFYVFGITRIFVPLFADPIGAKAFPTVIAAGMFISAIMLVFEHLRERKAADGAPAQWPALSWVVLGAVAWTAVYLAVFEWLGYIVGTTLYLIPLMIYFYPRRPGVCVAVAIIFCAVSYIGLAELLGAQLPTGTAFAGLLGG